MKTGKRGTLLAGFAVLSLVLVPLIGRADEVILKNGDHITGTILTADGGKLTIDSAIMGKVTVDLSNVKTFSTDEPIHILMQDGTMISQKVSAAADGTVSPAAGGSLVPQAIPLANVKKINPPPITWTGALAINGLIARGNTSVDQIGITAEAARRSDDDRISFNAGYLYGRQKVGGVDSTTADNWYFEGKYDLYFTPKFYGYAQARVEKDRVLNLNLRLTPGAGLGYQWFEQPDFNFSTEAGVSWVYEDYSTLPSPKDHVAVRLAYHVDKSFDSGKYKLFNDLEYFPSLQDSGDYLLLGTAGLRVALTKSMFSELKAKVSYDNHPGPGSSRVDAQYLLGVGWTF